MNCEHVNLDAVSVDIIDYVGLDVGNINNVDCFASNPGTANPDVVNIDLLGTSIR